MDIKGYYVVGLSPCKTDFSIFGIHIGDKQSALDEANEMLIENNHPVDTVMRAFPLHSEYEKMRIELFTFFKDNGVKVEIIDDFVKKVGDMLFLVADNNLLTKPGKSCYELDDNGNLTKL